MIDTNVAATIAFIVCVPAAITVGAIFGTRYSDRRILLTVLLLLVFFSASFNVYTAHNEKMESAEVTEATILSTSRGQSCSDTGCRHFVDIEYSYEYDGTEYTGGGEKEFPNAYDAGQWQQRNPAGEPILVDVIPDNPSESFLTPTTFAEAYWWKLSLLAFLLFLVGGWTLTIAEVGFSPHLRRYVHHQLNG
jgi:hypothetical protein